ncbi:15831_t:CDS:2, partial [Entrophospora sp. SA101]
REVGQEIILEMSETLGTKRSPNNKVAAEPSKKTKLDGEYYDLPVTSVESETNTTEWDLSSASAQIAKASKLRKYINSDIADKVLKTYKTSVLPGEKLTYEGVNVLNSAYSVMKDCDNEAVNFDSEKKIDKFIVDCEEDVLNYLDKFYEVNDLESLGKCLDEHQNLQILSVVLSMGKRHTIREIAEALEIPKSTISDNITRYKNSSFTTKPRTGRPQILDERDKREI